MDHIKHMIRGGEDCSAGERRLHRLYTVLAVSLLGAGAGVLALVLAACAYEPLPHLALLKTYFHFPYIILLNLLPGILVVWLGYLLFRRAWAACLLGGALCVFPALVNYYKIRLRGDPVLASDLRLARTAGGIVGHYTLDLTHIVLLVGAGFLCLLLGAALLIPARGPRGRLRAAGVMLCLTAAPLLCARAYLSEDILQKTENFSLTNRWSDVETFVSRGFWYPFLRSVPDAFPQPPEGYRPREAEAFLAAYPSAEIPAQRRVNIVGVMLEAFSDLTDFPMLAGQDAVSALYGPYHALEAQSVSGELLTNIFAGGTVDSEWGFLTGYSHHSEFRANVDSYVRYLKSQGYDTVYRHPGYGWFYNRRNVNEYLGFDESVFTDNGFGDLVKPEAAPYHSDRQLFDFLLGDLDARTPDSAPLFSFSVSYQNHGPYDAAPIPDGAVDPAATGWSEESCGILNHYLRGVDETIRELARFVSELETRSEPVVLVVFGDHKPWLGNGNSVYQELGVSLDLSTREGFYNYYSTPYLIWANSAAKRALGASFTGAGGDFSPCFLMPKLFDLCAWDGPSFMALSREMRALSPLVHERGIFLADGAVVDALPPRAEAFYRQFRRAEYWRETKALSVQ